MKKLLTALLLLPTLVFAAEDKPAEWQGTSLSDATIKKIQAAKYRYNKCIVKALENQAKEKVDIREGAAKVVKQCEPELSQVNAVYSAEKVPEVIIGRHMKQIRTQTTRNVLKQLMLVEAARKSGQKLN
ncbi:MAG: hypothetical protein RQ715_10975 [Methylococcales bacterium]|nr:hypothetical protein [Methylococcales bacterium]